MVCTNCGARLREADLFCPNCGTKAVRVKRCPDCGAVLQEGTKFCHKCGRPLEDAGSGQKASDDTIDIPLAAIEENILSETAAELKAARGKQSSENKAAHGTRTGSAAPAKSVSSRGAAGKGAAPGKRPAQQESRRRASGQVPPQKKRAAYKEEEDWEDDEWEDDDWEDDAGEGVDIITIMTVVIGCVLLVVIAVLGFNLYRQHVPKDYGQIAEEEQQEEEDTEQEREEGDAQTVEEDEEGGGETYTLTIVKNVNVRDNPSTSGTNILKVAQEGETYTCFGKAGDGDWYQIQLEDGSVGYVFQDYVTVE